MVMDGDVSVVEPSGATDFQYPGSRYPAAKVDRVLRDREEVRLGGSALVAHKTPGHTRGCTTWTMRVASGERPLHVVIVGSWNVNPGYRLLDRPGQATSYPGIAADFQHTFAVQKQLLCNVFLGAHGSYFDMLGKLHRLTARTAVKVWLDPQGYQTKAQERESAFDTELRQQSR